MTRQKKEPAPIADIKRIVFEVKGAVKYHDARRARCGVALASGPETGIAISSNAHHGYFLSPTCQLVFPGIFVAAIFTKSKLRSLYSERRTIMGTEVRPRWNFLMFLKRSLRKIIRRGG